MDDQTSLSEADLHYLASVRDECTASLGPGTSLLELRAEPEARGVRLVARYRLGARIRESTAVGESLLDAHRVLRARLLFDRIRFGFSDLVERP